MKGNKIRIFLKGLFKYIRIRYPLFIHIPITLLGFVIAKNYNLTLIFFVCISLAFAHFFVNSVNDLYDLDTDIVHEVKKIENPIISGELSMKQGKILTFSFPIIALLLAIPTNIVWFIMIIICIFLGWSYSMKPFRTRSKPLGFFINESLGASIQFIFAYLSASINSGFEFQWWIWMFSLYILGANGIMVCKDIPDVESDKHAGMRNFTQAYGIEVTRWFVIAMAIITQASGLVLTAIHIISLIGFILMVLATVLSITTMMKPAKKLKDRQTIYQRLPPASILYIISILVGAIMPLW
jgi:4-hydroxybenzoate polyprenyltransferase